MATNEYATADGDAPRPTREGARRRTTTVTTSMTPWTRGERMRMLPSAPSLARLRYPRRPGGDDEDSRTPGLAVTAGDGDRVRAGRASEARRRPRRRRIRRRDRGGAVRLGEPRARRDRGLRSPPRDLPLRRDVHSAQASGHRELYGHGRGRLRREDPQS